MSRDVSLHLQILGLDQRLAALEKQVVALTREHVRVLPAIFGPGKPYEKTLIGIDEAGAVMDEDQEALSRLDDESNPVQDAT